MITRGMSWPLRGRRWLEPLVIAGALAVIAAWSVRPLPPPQEAFRGALAAIDALQPAELAFSSEHNREPSHAPATFDRAAFQIPIWIASAPAPAPPSPSASPSAPPSAPPPPRLQLVAVIADGGARGGAGGASPTYKAMVYDPDTDKVMVVSAGERLGMTTITAIDQLSLSLSDEHGVRVLSLRHPGVHP